MKQEKNDELCFSLLRMMKGHELEDGGIIEGFTITFTDKKTGKKEVVEI